MHRTRPYCGSSRPIPRRVLFAGFALLLLAVAFAPLPAGAQLPASTAPPPAPPTSAGASLRLGSPPGTLAAAFQSAGAEFSVPPALLQAIAYVESHWESR